MDAAQHALHARIEDHHWWFVGRRTIVKRLIERLVPPQRGHLIIDVGCGTGANLAALAPSYRCFGLDESRCAIELARSRFSSIEYECATGLAEQHDRFAHASAVLLMDVLEHVEDDFALLSQVLSGVRPGAHVLITVPADPSLWTTHDETFGHWRRYDIERLRATWRGLAVEERLISPFNARLFPIIKGVRTLNQWRGAPIGRNGTDFAVPSRLFNGALEHLFAGEWAALARHIDRGTMPHRRGASLIAVLRRSEGPVVMRDKPATVAPDRRRGHDRQTGR